MIISGSAIAYALRQYGIELAIILRIFSDSAGNTPGTWDR
jgi:hypothetical protein